MEETANAASGNDDNAEWRRLLTLPVVTVIMLSGKTADGHGDNDAAASGKTASVCSIILLLTLTVSAVS